LHCSQALPEAAPLLATERNVRAKADELASLERWAPAPLLEATALLAGASGREPRVRAYALRSLTTASKPEEVSIRSLFLQECWLCSSWLQNPRQG